MVLGAVIGIVSVVVIGVSAVSSITGSTRFDVPGTVQVHLGAGPYKLYEENGHTNPGPNIYDNYDSLGPTDISASQVQVQGPGGPVAVSDTGPNERITEGTTVYSSVVSFSVPAAGEYTVSVNNGSDAQVLVGKSLSGAVTSHPLPLIGIPLGSLMFVLGLVLLIVAIVRRGRPRRYPPPGYGYPPPGYPGGYPAPGYGGGYPPQAPPGGGYPPSGYPPAGG